MLKGKYHEMVVEIRPYILFQKSVGVAGITHYIRKHYRIYQEISVSTENIRKWYRTKHVIPATFTDFCHSEHWKKPKTRLSRAGGQLLSRTARVSHLREVPSILQKHGLMLNIEKCCFGHQHLDYHGVHVAIIWRSSPARAPWAICRLF
jgi:hypothetical protein